ncbi:hypothetical protein RYA05_25040 [Pseudomonas syringae pv. actinidiae]|uniref:Uncharacterized protein n=1 Tax=Pseudomonas syringae pv. actinidiae TaxID=103796 RepID=A0AAN4PZW2_PSESF|nr:MULTISPECIES: hypothetical protein [Pseudomonas syringae group]EGH05031.1 hypothetical protein PSYAE_24333 [Pseudomonas amygdali pv. aesculi str. 0893_23]KPW09518.1 Uncharacterized protein ALO90_03960 [Pseudomonas amygdali pv. aesculi]MBL3602135.1 hypothetical protein [Pseudomonas syringae pv. actinidiae]MBL3620045.1 hypothetical protein [Pseudomonas syringae pv. actinidiae]MBL3631472.1 hypothetical protein [Pseudomonas syringae pv. actinidiae]
MLEMAVVSRQVRDRKENSQPSLCQSEKRLIQRFREITHQEKQQVLRLVDVLALHPEAE